MRRVHQKNKKDEKDLNLKISEKENFFKKIKNKNGLKIIKKTNFLKKL